jgi:phage-related baseplate assembly protein
MATLPTRSFNQIVTNISTGIQGRSSRLIDFAQGSPLRAIAEGFAGLFLWYQALVLFLLQAMRLSTASGVDVDTFTGDFQVYRLPAQSSSGTVIVSRRSISNTTAFIPVGTLFQVQAGGQKYVVTANPTFVGYSALLAGYTLAANTRSIIVPVKAIVAGSDGNVVANSINQFASPLTGLDDVTNPAALLNGFDSEPDQRLKDRFAAYILGLSRGDYFGTEYAILSTGITVQWQLVEDYDYAGNWHPGYYYVVADDGSGAPGSDFMTAVTAAVNSVRPLGVQAGVFPPLVTYAVVSMIVTTAAGYDHNTVCGLVAQTLENNINKLGLGNGLDFAILSSWTYTVAGVTRVSSVVLNGLSGDAASIAANDQVTIKCQSAIVS